MGDQIVGAAGATGRAVLRALASAGAPEIRALVHRESSGPGVRAAGATQTALVELADVGSLTAGFAGLDAVYLMSPLFSAHEVTYTVHALRAAERAGVRRVVYHSVLHPATPAMRHHERKAAAELEVRHADLEWVILQPAMYAETLVTMLRRAGGGPDVPVPYGIDTVFTPVSVADVAAVAAAALTDPGLDHGVFELAGPQRLSARTMFEELAAQRGRPVVAREVRPTDAALPATWGLGSVADAFAMWAYYDTHGLVGNPFVLRALLGREPTRFRDAVAARLRHEESSR